MAIKPITTFTGDSWKKQKEESPRAHHYFKEYKKQKMGRDKFIKLLLTEADERSAKGLLNFWGSDKTFNEKHQKEIQLYVDTDGKQGQCPKPCGTIKDWFELHEWFKRREDYTQFKDEEADLLIRAMVTEEKPLIAAEIIENIKLTNKQRKIQKQSNGTLSQDEAGAKSINTDIDSLKKLSNDDATKIDANVNAEVEADVKQQLSIAEDKEKKLKDLFERMEQMEYD